MQVLLALLFSALPQDNSFTDPPVSETATATNSAVASASRPPAVLPPSNNAEAPTRGAAAATLSGRIRELRRSLLGGGDKVRQAETQALDFYQTEYDGILQRLQSLKADTIAEQVDYETLLDSVLLQEDPERAESIARKARNKAEDLRRLRDQQEGLEEQGSLASSTVAGLRQRIDERERLLEDFEAGRDPERQLFLPPGIFAAAGESSEEPENPFDRQLLEDLALRDPQRARGIIAERDPALYELLWPPRPPHDLLRRIIHLPPKDPPGSR